jgi:hypothetical protein
VTAATPQPPDGRIMIETIGHELCADASRPQRSEIWYAIQQNPSGVKRIADQIRTSPGVLKPVPLLISKLRAGAHLAPGRGQDAKLSKLEAAHRLYTAKLADLDKHGVLVAEHDKPDAWAPGWTVEDAIAYAIDYTAPGDLELEAALRQRAGLPPYIVAERPPPEALAALERLSRPRPPLRRLEQISAEVQQLLANQPEPEAEEDPPPPTLAA